MNKHRTLRRLHSQQLDVPLLTFLRRDGADMVESEVLGYIGEVISRIRASVAGRGKGGEWSKCQS